MNPNTATNEELRDWLARRLGWEPFAGSWAHYSGHNYDTFNAIGDHPFPNTIDAAAKCLPEGWKWTIEPDYDASCFETRGERWAGYGPNDEEVYADRTTDEATDRFRLAAKAIQAMEDGK